MLGYGCPAARGSIVAPWLPGILPRDAPRRKAPAAGTKNEQAWPNFMTDVATFDPPPLPEIPPLPRALPQPLPGLVRFVGPEWAYWQLRINGAALLLVTLGIYRFWLMTDVRRFLWSNTEIAGETLEYDGLATELLLGFLFAIAILRSEEHT